jgi:hypothetical protein
MSDTSEFDSFFEHLAKYIYINNSDVIQEDPEENHQQQESLYIEIGRFQVRSATVKTVALKCTLYLDWFQVNQYNTYPHIWATGKGQGGVTGCNGVTV